jgi:hypothetical protein
MIDPRSAVVDHEPSETSSPGYGFLNDRGGSIVSKTQKMNGRENLDSSRHRHLRGSSSRKCACKGDEGRRANTGDSAQPLAEFSSAARGHVNCDLGRIRVSQQYHPMAATRDWSAFVLLCVMWGA